MPEVVHLSLMKPGGAIGRSAKAQSATEYLGTYGWAIMLVIIASAAILWLFVISPSRVTSYCLFDAGLKCHTYLLNNSGALLIDLDNQLGKPIEIIALRCTQESNAVLNSTDTLANRVRIPSGDHSILTNGTQLCYTFSSSGQPAVMEGNTGQAYKGKLYLKYRESDSGIEHVAVGDVLFTYEGVTEMPTALPTQLPTATPTPAPTPPGMPTQVQSAITACGTVIGTGGLPPGEYALAGALASTGGDCITINSGGNGSHVNCQGNELIGAGSGSGILLNNTSGNTVENCVIISFRTAVNLTFASSNSFTGNIAANNTGNGMSAESSSNNVFSNNIVNGNTNNGIYLSSSTGNNVTGNSVKFNGGYGFKAASGSSGTNIAGNDFYSNNATAYDLDCSASQMDGGDNLCRAVNGCGITCAPTSPVYSLNATNSTQAGGTILHSLYWEDRIPLSGYIFSFHNGSVAAVPYDWASPDQEAGTRQFVASNPSATTGWLNPASYTNLKNGWVNPTRAYTHDGTTFATAKGTRVNDTAYYNYNSSPAMIPSTSTILGIGLNVWGKADSSSGDNEIGFSLSNNSGTTYASTKYTTGDLGTGNTQKLLGGTANKWGLAWTPANANGIRVNASANCSSSSRTMSLDYVGLNITYTQPDLEANKSWVAYAAIGSANFTGIDLVSAIVTIRSYSPAGSAAAAQNDKPPDIEVGIWDGTAYANGALCNASSAMGNATLNATAWNCTVSANDAPTMSAWGNASNQKLRIRGVNMDAYGTGTLDEINVTGVFAYVRANNFIETWMNDSWVAMVGTQGWSNVTKTANSTAGTTIKWCVYANDSNNYWNSTSCAAPFNYETG